MTGASLTQAAAAQAADERALLQRARAGDAVAQDQLVRRYLPEVYGVAYRLLGRRDQAEDATQDAFLSALRALPRFRGDASFRTWLLRIAVNAARSHARRQGRWQRRELVLLEGAATPPPDALAAIEGRSEAERVQRALEQLPPKQRLAVTLRMQAMNYREIAEATGSTEGAARVNYHLGIRKLRELLQ